MMTTPKDLETALLDFITECEQSENCDGCMYREFCTRFVTPYNDDYPCEWEILKKSGGIPC